MGFKSLGVRALVALQVASLMFTGLIGTTPTYAADHRDSIAVDALPEGDLTDVFAFVDPAQQSNVILILPVNPFLNPSELPSARFSEEYLYQMKIDNGGTAQEDLVVQFEFHGGRAAQTYDVRIGTPTVRGPKGNVRLTTASICHGNSVYLGSAATTGTQANYIVPTGTNSGTASPGVRCFAGVADDSFQTDVGQAVFRVGVNPNATRNAPNHTQDVFRGFISTGLGPLRGRPVRANGTSGVDGFGGYDTSIMAVSVPKEMLRGTGIRGVSLTSSTRPAADPSLIGAWGTVSRPTTESFDGFETTHSDTYEQFERMGQQLANTVYIFQQPPQGFTNLTRAQAGLPGGNTPLTDSEIKDFFNASGPETDESFFSRYVPDSLTITNTSGDTSLLGNTIAGRAAVLTALGFTAPATGTPLLLPEAGLSTNNNRILLRQLVFPDYMRLDLDEPTDGVRRGAGTAGNGSSTFAIGKWGIQNGRRPADDVTDLYLRLNRELDDVKFPANLSVIGITGIVPGSGPQGSRRTLQCTQLALDGLPQILTPCEDARIFLVLQGTDWIETTQVDINNTANQVSSQRLLESSFPYLGLANPVPGEAGTTNFPPQQ